MNYDYSKIKVKIVNLNLGYMASEENENRINKALDVIQDNGGIVEKVETLFQGDGSRELTVLIVYRQIEIKE